MDAPSESRSARIARFLLRFRAGRSLSAELALRSPAWTQFNQERDALERERDELKAHCERLERQNAEGHAREQELSAGKAALLESRDTLETERNQLAEHCAMLNRQLAEGHNRENRLADYAESLLRARDALEQERDELAEQCRALNRHVLGADPGEASQEQIVETMRREWDSRARINAAFFTNSATAEWDESAYLRSGEDNVAEHILNDTENICQGQDPKTMRVLEIGCGAGRMTRALARQFGEVHAVDISSEMLRLARQRLSDTPNASFYQNNGCDLTVLPAGPLFDFAFSFIVFQHIPSAETIESYVREVHRLLKPGRLFKFQVQGREPGGNTARDTWLGSVFTVEDMRRMAERCGFEMRYWHGEGTQYFWVWLFCQ